MSVPASAQPSLAEPDPVNHPYCLSQLLEGNTCGTIITTLNQLHPLDAIVYYFIPCNTLKCTCRPLHDQQLYILPVLGYNTQL